MVLVHLPAISARASRRFEFHAICEDRDIAPGIHDRLPGEDLDLIEGYSAIFLRGQLIQDDRLVLEIDQIYRSIVNRLADDLCRL